MKNKALKKLMICTFTAISSMVYPLFDVKAQNSSSQVNVTVKLNICGDNIIEGPEDCEGDNLNEQTCANLDYAGGNLKCDIACSFDFTQCLPATPTPSPSIDTKTDLTQNFLNTLQTFLDRNQSPPLPEALKPYDLNNDGKILNIELEDTVKLWFNKRKESDDTCDLNYDGVCDLKDFSILMYYIDR